MKEVWRSIPRYRYYEVSNLGRVRSLDRVAIRMNPWGARSLFRLKGRILKPRIHTNGYLGVQLGAASKNYLVHRLVAAAFVERRRGARQVNHLDGVRDHNKATNLAWVTCSENHLHSYRVLTRKMHVWARNVTLDGKVYPTVNCAARYLGVTSGSVSSAAKHGHLRKGFKVSYV